MPRITALYAWVIADKDDDDEGVPAVEVNRMAMPLMGADIERANALKPFAQLLSNQTGKPLKLIRSVSIEEIDTITPGELFTDKLRKL